VDATFMLYERHGWDIHALCASWRLISAVSSVQLRPGMLLGRARAREGACGPAHKMLDTVGMEAIAGRTRRELMSAGEPALAKRFGANAPCTWRTRPLPRYHDGGSGTISLSNQIDSFDRLLAAVLYYHCY
jgi:hypothetical protein